MNYLAHSFLSGNESGLIVGNFIADHLQGNHFENIPDPIVEGIKMHRSIDTFTDSHPLFKESKRLFYKDFEKYSGILVDIYFDHVLASSFTEFSKNNLQEHCDRVYRIYSNHNEHLPKGSKRFLSYVLSNNTYYAYSEIEGIETVLKHLSYRIRHGIALNDSISVFKENEKTLRENFSFFMKDAIQQFNPKTDQ